MTEPNRKLAAILSADVVGYSRLMAADEAATVETLKEYRIAIGRVIERHKGRVVNSPGDNILAQFPSAVEAVQAAVEIQKVLEGRNLELAPERRMSFRIGVNLGDVIEEADGTIYGDGVNIAARMEALAEAGGICVSSSVYDAVAGKIDFGFDFLGAQQVKNIDRPINVYRVRSAPGAGQVAPAKPRGKGRRRLLLIATAAAAVGVVLAGGAYWFLRPAPAPIETETAPDAGPVASLPVIAVLPFTNLSNDPEQDYFADGITEDIITALSDFQFVGVIARNSTFVYKGRAMDIRTIATDLNANYVVEGSVRRSAERIRVTVQLIDTSAGNHVWGQTYDRELTASDIFDIQSDIANRVATTIADRGGILSRELTKAVQRKGTDRLSSYDCVLRQHEYLRLITPESHLAARNCLEQTVAIDPNYAEAWGSLAELYADTYALDFNPIPDALERALMAAERGLAIDRDNKESAWALAFTYFQMREKQKFLDHIYRFIELNPNDAYWKGTSGWAIMFADEWERGLALIEDAIEHNPHHPGWWLYPVVIYHYVNGRYDEALSRAEQIRLPDLFWTPLVFAAIHGQRGDQANAKRALNDMLALNPDVASRPQFYVGAYVFSQDVIDKVIEGLRKAGLETPEGPARPVIAVLPFTNMSGDAEQEYFADGITEDIITALSRFQDIAVIGRNSTFQYKGKATDIRSVAKDLGADFVLEGSVRRTSDNLRVTAQLVSGRDAAHIWAESFDGALTPETVFDTQDTIARQVAVQIADTYGAINLSRMAEANARPSASLRGYECVLLFNQYARHASAASHAAALACLERAAAQDPNDAEVLAVLSEAYTDDYAIGWGNGEDGLRRGLEVARKAIEADSRNQRAHASLAYAQFIGGDKSLFLSEADTAIRLNPNRVDVVGSLAAYMIWAGEWERGGDLLLGAMRLNPQYAPWHDLALADYHIWRGDFERALISARKVETAQTDNVWPYLHLAVIYGHMGDAVGAAGAIKRVRELRPDFARVAWEESRKWLYDEGYLAFFIDGLRKAGLDIPDEPGATK